MLGRLPYRAQIPLGLALAVVIAALLVTVVSARIWARSVRQETLDTLDRAMVLLVAQSRPLLAADDTWAVFTLLRDTTALLPGAEAAHARAAVLDMEGRVFAASEPARLEIGRQLLGGAALPPPGEVSGRIRVDQPGGAVTLIDPIRSEDGQRQGFVYSEVDAAVFEPDWARLSQPALIGVLLAIVFLVPAGWWIGGRMTRPVASLAHFIERIGREDAAVLHAEVPRTSDPELGRIGDAVDRLIEEMRTRQQAERRATAAERMAAVGRLTAAVAHEINNPLAGLLTATQTMRLHGGSEVPRAQALALIERGLRQIQSTVAALLPQARIEDRPLEANDLADVVALVLPDAAAAGVDVRSQVSAGAGLRVPSAVMRQVMLNLLVNAVNAAGRGGWVRASLEADARAVRFTVSNSGARLGPDGLERIVAAESGDNPRGFGLWVCRELATQFGGGLSVAESATAATELLFWIPNREHDANTAAA